MNPFPANSKGAELYVKIEILLKSLALVYQPSQRNYSLTKELQSLSIAELVGGPISNRNMGEAVRVGLLLAIDAWEEAHSLAQDLDTVEGSYWHGIVHRREPDEGNAKYWFKKVGQHPVLQRLGCQETRKAMLESNIFDEIVQSNSWGSFVFIDLCLACESGQKSNIKTELLILQAQEIRLLLEHCINGAISS